MKSVRAATSLAGKHSSKHGIRRSFSAIGRRKAASNFTMPALSPTMTEGGIAGWRVKEGASFSAGDVLLEIETDKATMDVEAQDDGIMMKIIAPDQSKAIQVGARIAVIAEPGDDISSLDLPPDESPKQADKKQEQKQEKPKDEPQEKETKPQESESKSESSTTKQESKPQPSSSKQSGKGTKQTYPLYPSVQHLLHENGIPDSAADEIPASGPKGRLLKGDVLAYLGRIDKSYPSEASARLSKLSHLDLSNIQLAEPAPKPASSAAAAAAAAQEAPAEPQEVDLALPISLTAVFETQKRVEQLLNTTIPLSVLIGRASELANEDLPLPRRTQISGDELFNAVLGLPRSAKTVSRGHFVPHLSTIDLARASGRQSSRQPDIIDILSGSAPARTGASSRRRPQAVSSPAEQDLFSVTAKPGEEQRAMVYLERLKNVLEKDPGRLVV